MAKLDANNVENILPLTKLQYGMLYHSISDEAQEIYSQQLVLHIKGNIDVNRMQEAFELIVQSNEALRCVFAYKGMQKAVQVVLKKVNTEVKESDLRGIDANSIKNQKEQIRQKQRIGVKDLEQGPVCRLHIIRIQDSEYELLISYHHIVMDGWSLSVLLEGLFNSYEQMLSRKKTEVLKTNAFSSYVRWMEREDKQKSITYWENYLSGFQKDTRLQICGGNNVKAINVRHEKMQIPESLMQSLKETAAECNTSVATIFYTAWAVILRRYCQSTDIIFGTTISGRLPHIAGIENAIGTFVNTVPLRVNIQKDSLRNIIKNIHGSLLERKNHEMLHLLEMKADDRNISDLFDTIVVIENYPLDVSGFSKPNLEINSFEMEEVTNYPFVLSISFAKDVEVELIYQTNHDQSTIRKLLEHFYNVLNTLAFNVDTPVNKVCILNSEEELFIKGCNNTEKPTEESQTLIGMFEEQAKSTPDHIAVVDETNSLSYCGLNLEASNIAGNLLKLNNGSKQPVGIMLGRSVQLVAGILAVLKTGAAFVPLNIYNPVHRTREIVKLCGIEILLADSETENICRKLTDICQIVNIYKLTGPVNEACTKTENVTGGQLAYIMFTSGSTGTPKGVKISHHAIANTISWRKQYYHFTSEDVVLQMPNISFDSAIEDIFTPLASGGKLVMVAEENTRNVQAIGELIIKYGVTHMLLIPGFYDVLLHSLSHALVNMRFITVAGELCSNRVIKDHFGLLKNVELYNEYGPAENSVCSTVYKFEAATDDGRNIGWPIQNTKCYVIYDEQLQPSCVPGELYLSGNGLFEGYIESTEVQDDHTVVLEHIAPDRLYKTGDWASRNPDGSLCFLSRVDELVKINGVRIDLGDIENNLLKFPRVVEAAVVCVKENNTVLVAFLVMEEPMSVEELDQYMMATMPPYMLPNRYVVLESLPVNSNGKRDKNALAEKWKSIRRAEQSVCENMDNTQKSIHDIWKDLLNVENIGLNDKFYEIGGNSIQIIEMTNRINKYFHTDYQVSDMFKYITIEKLAKKIDTDKPQNARVFKF